MGPELAPVEIDLVAELNVVPSGADGPAEDALAVHLVDADTGKVVPFREPAARPAMSRSLRALEAEMRRQLA